MMYAHTLGLPRIGPNRELKRALEEFWAGSITASQLREKAAVISQANLQLQIDKGLDIITVGDFSLYDHVLDTSLMLGCIPDRVREASNSPSEQMFLMARGRHPGNPNEVAASRMTKWFDTNYHYIVPEISSRSKFSLNPTAIMEQIRRAQKLGREIKPVILGPVSWLYLSDLKTHEEEKGKLAFDRLRLLPEITELYVQLLAKLAQEKISWVQIDEPILALDLENNWHSAFETTYQSLATRSVRIMLATYFGSVEHNLDLIAKLKTEGVHLDLVHGSDQLDRACSALNMDTVLSLGLVNGRNIWISDIAACAHTASKAAQTFKTMWMAPSCSLLHSPYDVTGENKLDASVKSWLSFAVQKLDEIVLLRNLVTRRGDAGDEEKFAHNRALIEKRASSTLIHNSSVAQRVKDLPEEADQRNSVYEERGPVQKKALNLPLLPTTTIGSFPQTKEIRRIRREHRNGKIDAAQYQSLMQEQIQLVISRQEEYGLDVLVHGEAERNDMVEYFGEHLSGFAFTENGWVQSYGSRCVKPPVIYGDVSRAKAMTVDYARYAQSLTSKHVKGMLTGPITILQWSFVRDDQPRSDTCLQIALALRDEVSDLETAGIRIIQIDEPALREGLPLRKADWDAYVDWATRCFRISACSAADQTQIHTHMCYSSFGDVIGAIVKMDADVISIESARSDMAILQSFVDFEYPNEIGLGVYDIHSPNAPAVEDICTRLRQAEKYIPAARIWVNPDCGLKTRQWEEVKPALENMVASAQELRRQIAD
ncbi:MAG: 5-methyltetrahydropteroyltriglutamate--homocysteine S-methyltransferase [Gammaproteobacteria bacterium]|nr:5-methyltetrahydropteroyltriglutamate--homocysteine S-methyltransferase [Gammaproteobacteria bacterium]